MPRQVATDTIEILGSSTKQAGKQVAQIPFRIIETAQTQMTQNTETQNDTHLRQGFGGQAETQKGNTEEQKGRETQKRLTYLEEELRAIRAKKTQEKEIQVKQEEQKKVATIQQLEVEKKKQEMPQRLRDAKQKGGTGERRKRGGDG